MRTEPSQLLPLFRSDGQGRLLARVYLAPDRPEPIAGLARDLDLDAGGLTREADRLERAGLVRSERIGRQRLLRPNADSPYYDDLYGLLMTAFGPATVIGPGLGDVAGIAEAFIFGSWAARYTGVPGPDPADIDVVIVGAPSRAAVARALAPLADRLGREVNETIVSVDRWRRAREGFVRQVKRGPLVPLALDADSGPSGADGRPPRARMLSARRPPPYDDRAMTSASSDTAPSATLRSLVPAAVADIVRAADPVRVILFGSVARGDDGPDSDLDLLVVVDAVAPGPERRRLMGTIRSAIGVRAPIDVFVTDPAECERRRDVVGSLHYWPLREGEVVYERAA